MGAGHGEKLTRKQERAIAALLIAPTLGDAASRVGVHVNTLRTWMRQEGFAETYSESRKRLIGNAIGRLQHAVFAATDALEDDLRDQSPEVRHRAAELLLGTAVKATELLQLAERVENLEARLRRSVNR